MATIKDVAKDAGVSPSTVSRVINDHDRISPATRERVKESMDKIGYYPNVIAQNLVNQETKTIGLIMPYSTSEAFADPFYAEVLRGIGEVAQNDKYSMLLITCEDKAESELEAGIRAVRGKQVDGLLILRAVEGDPLIKELKKLEIPFVVLGRPKNKDDIYWVNNDNIRSSKDIVQYLIDLGHEKIGCITGNKEYVVYEDRLKGYKQALDNNNIEFNSDYVISCKGGKESSYQATLKLLDANPDITAIFAVDDVMAYGTIKAANKLKLDVPKDLAVVGFNNNPFSGLISPPLTTVDINTYDLGIASTRMLIDVIKSNPLDSKSKIIDTNIIIRESCGNK